MTDSTDGPDGDLVGGILAVPLLVSMFLFVGAVAEAYRTGNPWNALTLAGLVFYGIYGAAVTLVAVGRRL